MCLSCQAQLKELLLNGARQSISRTWVTLKMVDLLNKSWEHLRQQKHTWQKNNFSLRSHDGNKTHNRSMLKKLTLEMTSVFASSLCVLNGMSGFYKCKIRDFCFTLSTSSLCFMYNWNETLMSQRIVFIEQ